MMSMYNAKQAAAIYEVSTETIRTWSNEFAEFLTPMANPGRGRSRTFSESDMTVFSLISEQKKMGFVYSDIYTALENGERGDPPEVDPKDAQRLVRTEGEKRMVLQIETLQRELIKAYEERDRALAKAENTQQLEIERARLEQKVESLLAQLQDANQRIAENEDLREQLGELRGELNVLRKLLDDRD